MLACAKSLEGNTVLNILCHDWKERTGGCLCCWLLWGKSNRNHVITPIFLPCPSVAFPKRSVYLQIWCFLCYRGLLGLVIHHHLKKGTFFPVLQMSFLIRKTDVWNFLFAYAFLPVVFCSAWTRKPGTPLTGLHGSVSTSTAAQEGWVALLFWTPFKQSKDLISSLPARGLSFTCCGCTQ